METKFYVEMCLNNNWIRNHEGKGTIGEIVDRAIYLKNREKLNSNKIRLIKSSEEIINFTSTAGKLMEILQDE